ncbi:MAG: energy-coupling factor ABC transporter substrate-binding protein [Methanobacteriota archaeon]
MKFKLVTIFLVSLFLPIVLAEGEKWSGTDDQAEGVIGELTGGEYKPWFEPIWEPPSGEIESLLFTLQAAIGAITIGYFIGYYKGKNAAG